MSLDQLVYKPGKELIGYKDGKYMYTINGISYGKIQDKYIFDKNGKYIGEFNLTNCLVDKKRNVSTLAYKLPENQEKLSKKMMLVGIIQKLGVLAKPSHGALAAEFNEYPDTKALESLH